MLPCMSSISLSFAFPCNLSLLFFQMGLHAEWVDEPREFALKMLAELSLIISTAASIILNQKRQSKL